jgi:hypothetical protein
MCEYDVHTKLTLAYEPFENFKNRETTVLRTFWSLNTMGVTQEMSIAKFIGNW